MTAIVLNRREKRYLDTTLTLLFAVVVITGIILHIKSHGYIIEPRPIIKAVHYCCGYLMSICLAVHAWIYSNALRSLSRQKHWFGFATYTVAILFIAVFATGTLKLCRPVKIHGLGLWHYSLGIVMALAACAHLGLTLPWLIKSCRRR